MADNANQINRTVNSANGSHTPNTNTSNTLNGLNTNANNAADNQLPNHYIPHALAITEFVLGAVEYAWGGDDSAKRVGEKAMHDGAESFGAITRHGGRIEGMIEGQVQRVWFLLVLLREQGLLQLIWDYIRYFAFRIWVLIVRPWALYVLRWLGLGRRVARE
jgi:hypothetical protein